MRFIATTFVMLLCIGVNTHNYAETVEVKNITFQGLKYVTQREIIQHSVAVSQGRILIDIQKLQQTLRSNIMIHSFSVDIENRVCAITVVEKAIIAVILIDAENGLVTVEIDDNLTILPTYRVYAYDRPIIKISTGDVVDNKLSERIISIVLMLKKMRDENSAIGNRISVINCVHPKKTYIQLHGAQSKYIWDESYSGLILFNSVIGLYDAKSARPDNAIITKKNMVVW